MTITQLRPLSLSEDLSLNTPLEIRGISADFATCRQTAISDLTSLVFRFMHLSGLHNETVLFSDRFNLVVHEVLRHDVRWILSSLDFGNL